MSDPRRRGLEKELDFREGILDHLQKIFQLQHIHFLSRDNTREIYGIAHNQLGHIGKKMGKLLEQV